MKKTTKKRIFEEVSAVASVITLEVAKYLADEYLKKQKKAKRSGKKSAKRNYVPIPIKRRASKPQRPNLEYTKTELEAAMQNVTVVDHPLIQDKVTRMRDRHTPSWNMYQLAKEIAQLLCYEATRDLALKEVEVETPISKTWASKLKCDVVIVPILRAGLAMADGIMMILSRSATAHIGMYRDEETLLPQSYFNKYPLYNGQVALIVDPMLATGGSASLAVSKLKEQGYTDIRMLSIFSVPEGLVALHKAHPDVKIFVCTVDKKLNDKGYIVPGCGDAGDRIFGAS